MYICKYCKLPVTKEGVDETEGDCCSGNDLLQNENETHVPIEGRKNYLQGLL